MGVVTATCKYDLTVSDVVTSGYVSAQTISQVLKSPTVAGASLTYANGTGAGAIDLAVFEPIALVASTPQTFDLTSLTGLGGESADFARVREFLVFNPDATAGHDITVYRGASNGWSILPDSTHPLSVRAKDGSLRLSDPSSTGGGNGNVTGGSSKTFTLDPGTHNVTVYLLILGGSAA